VQQTIAYVMKKTVKRNSQRLINIACLVLAIGVFFSAFGHNVWAESEEADKSVISVESYVDRATITIGDRILYTLKIVTDPKVALEPPSLGSNLGAFEVKDYKFYDPQKIKDGKVINKSEYLITTFTTGEYVIPPITIRYTDPEGAKKEIRSEPLFILVKSVGASESDKEDIRGLKSPIEIKESYWAYLIILPILALLTTGGFLYYRRRARGLAMPEIPEELRRPAWEVALMELNNLRDSDLLERKQIKRFFTVLSDIIRKYIQRRYEIPTLDRTTEEIRGEIKRAKPEQRIVESVYSLLFFCDFVKFAKYVPSSEETEKSLSHAYDLVNTTRPVEIKPEVLVKK
jgi:hypothetical protein